MTHSLPVEEESYERIREIEERVSGSYRRIRRIEEGDLTDDSEGLRNGTGTKGGKRSRSIPCTVFSLRSLELH